MVFGAFVHHEVDVDCFIVVPVNGIVNDFRVAVAEFVILVDEVSFVFFVEVFNEFFRAEKVKNVPFFVGFFHRPFERAVRNVFVSFDSDLVDFNFLFLVNIYVENYLISRCRIGAFHYGNNGIAESFFIEIPFYDGLCGIYLVGCDLNAFHHRYFLLNVIALAFFHARVADIRHARTVGKPYFEPGAVAFYPCLQNFNIGKQALSPKPLHGIGNFFARDLDFLSFCQSRKGDQHKRLFFVHGSFDAGNGDVGNGIFFGCGGVIHHRNIGCWCSFNSVAGNFLSKQHYLR